MDQSVAVTTIAHQIQLAVAPVFLLAGIGGFLNVLTHRLARVVDRSRYIEAMAVPEGNDPYAAELKLLDRRMAVVNLSISFCTAGALWSAWWWRSCSSPTWPGSPSPSRSPCCSSWRCCS